MVIEETGRLTNLVNYCHYKLSVPKLSFLRNESNEKIYLDLSVCWPPTAVPSFSVFWTKRIRTFYSSRGAGDLPPVVKRFLKINLFISYFADCFPLYY